MELLMLLDFAKINGLAVLSAGRVALLVGAVAALGLSSAARAEDKTAPRKLPAEESRQITEGIIDAPLDAVWNAFATKEGQEAWNVAHAEIDLKIGGKMRTHYDPKGKIGDANTIENIILAFEPRKMLAIQVGKPPEKFPFKDAIKNVWHVLYFEEAGPNRTRVRLVGLGYSADEESKKLRAFFEKGNAYSLKRLQEHFAKK